MLGRGDILSLIIKSILDIAKESIYVITEMLLR